MGTYCFDLDGTLCVDTNGDYLKATPYPEVIAELNRLKKGGHNIIVFTARGSATGIDWRLETERQLMEWGVLYDRLVLGKPAADVYIDDKAVNVVEFRLTSLGRLSPDISSAKFS